VFAGDGGPNSVVHLFKLSRGLTPALITGATFSNTSDRLAVSSARGTTHIFQLGPAASVPMSSAAARTEIAPPVQHLSAAARLRSASGWTARVPGAPLAAAAAGLYNGGPGTAGPCAGAIAATFALTRARPGIAEGSHLSSSLAYEEPQGLGAEADEELLVAGPDGVLTRYRLCPAVEGAPASEDDSAMFGTSPASVASSMSGVDDGELATEVAARLDICRRPSWPEHDEFGGAAVEPNAQSAQGRAAVPVGPFQRTGASEEERHAFIANAELCRHSRHAGLWAAGMQFHFLEIQPQKWPGSTSERLSVEELPTRRVDVARGELRPTRIGPAHELSQPQYPPSGSDPGTTSAPHSRCSSASSSAQRAHQRAVELDVEGAIAQVEAFEF